MLPPAATAAELEYWRTAVGALDAADPTTSPLPERAVCKAARRAQPTHAGGGLLDPPHAVLAAVQVSHHLAASAVHAVEVLAALRAAHRVVHRAAQRAAHRVVLRAAHRAAHRAVHRVVLRAAHRVVLRAAHRVVLRAAGQHRMEEVSARDQALEGQPLMDYNL